MDRAGGGPNTEFVLGLARELDGKQGIWALACDTDGIDGSEDNAGAWCGPDTIARTERNGVNVDKALAEHNSHGVFTAIDGLVVSGATLTNVNDFRAVVIDSGY